MRMMEKRIREKKLKEDKEHEQREEGAGRFLAQVLNRDAIQYLNGIRSSRPEAARRIEEILEGLVAQGRLRQKDDRLLVKAIERKVRGIEPTITFVRKGKRTDLRKELKE